MDKIIEENWEIRFDKEFGKTTEGFWHCYEDKKRNIGVWFPPNGQTRIDIKSFISQELKSAEDKLITQLLKDVEGMIDIPEEISAMQDMTLLEADGWNEALSRVKELLDKYKK